MKVNTPHRGFNKLANRSLVGRGVIISAAQRSNRIRAFTDTHSYTGKPYALGDLQKRDIEIYFKGYNVPASIKEYLIHPDYGYDKALYVYLFKTYGVRNRDIVHGWIVTTDNHRVIYAVPTSNTAKCNGLIQYMVRALERGYGEL